MENQKSVLNTDKSWKLVGVNSNMPKICSCKLMNTPAFFSQNQNRINAFKLHQSACANGCSCFIGDGASLWVHINYASGACASRASLFSFRFSILLFIFLISKHYAMTRYDPTFINSIIRY